MRDSARAPQPARRVPHLASVAVDVSRWRGAARAARERRAVTARVWTARHGAPIARAAIAWQPRRLRCR